MKVKILIFKFKCDKFIRESGVKLRGYFAENFNRYTLIHHHLENDKFLYKYPLIQYKILKGQPTVLGINDGADILQEIYEEIEYLKFDGKIYPIKEKVIILRTENLEATDNLIHYQFLTPYLALNQENYRKYITSIPKEKHITLNKILIGNILSISKSLSYVVLDEIKVNTKLKQVKTKLKGVDFIGFTGEFQVNFNLPDYIGLGKSVSRGFGTIVRK